MVRILFLLLFCLQLSYAQPFLCFTDIVKGPATGNSDNSQPNQVGGQDGAIVTVWGKELGNLQSNSKVFVGGKEARVYSWENATYPADLFTMHRMQMVSFQVPGSLPLGPTTIQVRVNGQLTNALPFTVATGNIYFVDKNGDDTNGNGSWQKPWKTLDNQAYTGALEKMKPGDIVYLRDGFVHTAIVGDRACIDIGNPGTKDLPKAIIAYPKASASIGGKDIQRTFSLWVSGIGPSSYWTLSKLNLTAINECASMYHGFRVVCNKITAPLGDGPTGAISGLGNDLYLLGNELTNIGDSTTSKLYHPIYIQSHEACQGTRLPTERNREIAWNYLHDNLSYDGINIYRECGSSAYMTDHRVHDNVIINQTGCGIRVGDYVTGENHFYNNIVLNAGLGPDPPNSQAMHVPVLIHAGWDDTTTTIHFYNNTIVGGGFTKGADWASSMVGFSWNHPFKLDFRNNIILSTNDTIKFLNHRFAEPTGVLNNVWGRFATPPFDMQGLASNENFVDLLSKNLRLLPSSKSIDYGFPNTATPQYPLPTYDFDCKPRRGRVDAGAFEYTSNTVDNEELDPVSFKIAPNPGTDYFEILPNDLIDRVVVRNLNGQVIHNSQSSKIDATSWSNGLYIVELKDHAKSAIIKWVKL
jgi:uncharacterized protein (TIGR03437 family)